MGITSENDIKQIGTEILDDMLRCNTVCTDISTFKKTEYKVMEDFIDWLYHNLPSMSYVVDRIINFIFSNGLTTGDEEQDKKLDAFLYAQNIQGVSNLNVLREAIKQALVFGKNGIRWLGDDGIINVNSRHYACLLEDNETHYGFKEVIGFIVSVCGEKIWDMNTEELDFDRDLFERTGVVIDKDRKIMILSKDELLNLRNDTSKNDGVSPLKYDQQRLQLLAAFYERLNHDIIYDGPGRILLRVNKNYTGENAQSTGQILNQGQAARDGRTEKIKKEIEDIGKQIKKSSSDNVIAISDYFDGDIEHLPRVTKATELLKWATENEGRIIAQMLGISPTLVGVDKISGNISQDKIIDKDMLGDIIPLREKFAVQISTWIADKIGVRYIYFDKYEMKQVVDENDSRMKVVKQAIDIRRYGNEQDQRVADGLMDMLDGDIRTANGELKTLATKKVGFFKKILNIITRKKERN